MLKDVIEADSVLASHVTSLSWTMQTKRANPRTLASLIRMTQPTSLALGSGFFASADADLADLCLALNELKSLRCLIFGGFDLSSASSDYVSHSLSSKWHDLKRLELHQVRWQSPCGNITRQDAFWQSYMRPSFSLERLSIAFVQPRPTRANWGSGQHSWLYWLLSESCNSLTSLRLINLGEAIPEDASKLLLKASRNLKDLVISDYEGSELIADFLAAEASNLLSLTLGARLIEILLANGQIVPVLASKAILENRSKLRFLEVRDLRLFERLDLQTALEKGALPSLQHIVLTQSSRLHTQVQDLARYCTQAGIILQVKR